MFFSLSNVLGSACGEINFVTEVAKKKKKERLLEAKLHLHMHATS